MSRNETAVWKCPLGENTVEGKGKFPISKADFVAVLANASAAARTVYFQDYIWRPLPVHAAPRPSTHTRGSACASCSPWPSLR